MVKTYQSDIANVVMIMNGECYVCCVESATVNSWNTSQVKCWWCW